jgi:hypothetical protein
MRRSRNKKIGPQDAATSQGPNAKAVEAIASHLPYTKGKTGRNRVLKIDRVLAAYQRGPCLADDRTERGDGL